MGDKPELFRKIAHALAALAARQHGNVTRQQLLALGLRADDIDYRLTTARLHRVHAGVYAVGRPPVTPLERAAAAVLACGPRAALSHASAMVLWGLWRHWPDPFEVSILSGDRRPARVTVHRSRSLERRDFTTERGVRVTTPARTLLDCARRMSARQLTRAANGAWHARILRPSHIEAILARCPTHPGARRLRAVALGTNATRSGLEEDFQAFCARYGLPVPMTNAMVAGREVDAFFPVEGVIVEIDSWEFHQDRVAFEADRERDASALEHGYPTVRLTDERMGAAPAAEAARLEAILARYRRAA